MTMWTSHELTAIGSADELRLAFRRRDGTLSRPRPVWVVRHGDELYARSVNGPSAAWYRGALATRAGHVEAAGVSKDIIFADPEAGIDGELDVAYRGKYRRYAASIVESVLAPRARSAAVRLVPR
jgi:hypothetical protein